MDTKNNQPILKKARDAFEDIAREHGLLDREVSVLVKTLSPEEAIGTPGRRDFPILIGQERVIEAEFLGAKAHAFTDSPCEFVGTLQGIIDLPLVTNGQRALCIATVNAVLRHLNIIESTLHCKDEEPEKCAAEISSSLLQKFGRIKIGLIGLNPAITARLSQDFGPENLRITDLNKLNIGSTKFGVEIWDGNLMTKELVAASDLVVLTGTTLVNDTFDTIWDLIGRYKRDYLIFGVTASGVCELTGLNRICPYGRK
jgi:uncharacterized protein (DUF4213/DUF364 family)